MPMTGCLAVTVDADLGVTLPAELIGAAPLTLNTRPGPARRPCGGDGALQLGMGHERRRREATSFWHHAEATMTELPQIGEQPA